MSDRHVTIPASVYDTAPDWWERQAVLGGFALTVTRGPRRGASTTYPDGGYDHVCTRADLAGADLGRWVAS